MVMRCRELTDSRKPNGGNGSSGVRKRTNGSTTSSAQTYPGRYTRINVTTSARIRPHSFTLNVVAAHVEPCSAANHARWAAGSYGRRWSLSYTEFEESGQTFSEC
jgi:hypothetical protein